MEKKVVLQTQPQLQKGINVIQKPDNLPVFQSLIGKALNGRNATAVWIDSKNECSTYALSSYGGPDILEKVSIGRAFTPFQHHSLMHQLEDFTDQETELLVLPNIDHLYLDGQVKPWEAEQLFEEVWQKVLEVQEEHDLKVLVSTTRKSRLSYLVSGSCDSKIKVETTNQGWKYDSRGFNQLFYQHRGNFQTTLPYWAQKTTEKVELTAKRV